MRKVMREAMKNSGLHVLALLLLLAVPMAGLCGQYRLHFRSGRVVVGEIVLRNEDVVVVTDSYGARFQFPMTDIIEITEIVEQQPADGSQASDVGSRKSRSVTNIKRTSLGVRAAGGLVSVDGKTGGAVAADFRLGANNIANRRIFLGGQVGYRALMVEQKVLSVIPIDAVLELPMTETDHAPMIGANIGYGIGVGDIRGGVNAGLTLAYRYHFSRTGCMHAGIGAEVQQFTFAPHNVTVDTNQTFTSTGGRTAVMGLITLGVLF